MKEHEAILAAIYRRELRFFFMPFVAAIACIRGDTRGIRLSRVLRGLACCVHGVARSTCFMSSTTAL